MDKLDFAAIKRQQDACQNERDANPSPTRRRQPFGAMSVGMARKYNRFLLSRRLKSSAGLTGMKTTSARPKSASAGSRRHRKPKSIADIALTKATNELLDQ